MNQREKFLSAVLSQVGSPYGYGSKGTPVNRVELVNAGWPFPLPPNPRRFDCSGLVAWGWLLATGIDWLNTHDCDRLMRACQRIAKPRNGSLVFYGRQNGAAMDAQHVVIYVDRCVVGANGGDGTTLTIARAVEQNARVCFRPGEGYRKDVLGYFDLPWSDEPEGA